jgi:hypothetical protein
MQLLVIWVISGLVGNQLQILVRVATCDKSIYFYECQSPLTLSVLIRVEVYPIQCDVIKYFNDLLQIGCFPRVYTVSSAYTINRYTALMIANDI